MCVAGGGGPTALTILTSTDPTGGASAWTRASIPFDRGTLDGVSCPSVSLCVATTNRGDVVTATDPTGGASAWTSASVDVPGCRPQSTPCISEQLYAHDDRGTRVVDTAPPGGGNSIRNVILDGESSLLSWTHDGAQRRLELR